MKTSANFVKRSQLSLFDEPEPLSHELTELEQHVEQIARDMETLRMDPVFWAPSREFYEERIQAHRDACQEILNYDATALRPL